MKYVGPRHVELRRPERRRQNGRCTGSKGLLRSHVDHGAHIRVVLAKKVDGCRHGICVDGNVRLIWKARAVGGNVGRPARAVVCSGLDVQVPAPQRVGRLTDGNEDAGSLAEVKVAGRGVDGRVIHGNEESLRIPVEDALGVAHGVPINSIHQVPRWRPLVELVQRHRGNQLIAGVVEHGQGRIDCLDDKTRAHTESAIRGLGAKLRVVVDTSPRITLVEMIHSVDGIEATGCAIHWLLIRCEIGKLSRETERGQIRLMGISPI